MRTKVVSAHRTPERLYDYARAAAGRGLKVIVAGAGGAAHLPGMAASMTHLPVLGVPVETKALAGLDSLLSIVQMPAGVPVGTLAIGKAGAINAGLLAAAILATSDASAGGAAGGVAAKPDRRRRRSARMIVPPGATIGIIGGGQLGRMLALAAAQLGYRCHVYAPDEKGPAALVAARFTRGAFDDEAALARFADEVEIVTYEFENIPTMPLAAIAARVPLYPPIAALEIGAGPARRKGLHPGSGRAARALRRGRRPGRARRRARPDRRAGDPQDAALRL